MNRGVPIEPDRIVVVFFDIFNRRDDPHLYGYEKNFTGAPDVDLDADGL